MKRTLITTGAVCLLIDATVFTATQASHIHDGTQWLVMALLGACALVALFAALGAGFGAGWQSASAARYKRRLAREQQPVTCTCSAGHELSAVFDEYWAETRKAVAMAAVAAEPMQPQTVTYTAVMPTVVQSGVTFGFGPHGVVDAPPEEWTPSVSPSARHAAPVGMPAGLAEFNWEPAGVLR